MGAQLLELTTVPENQQIQRFEDDIFDGKNAPTVSQSQPILDGEKIEAERLQNTEAVVERPASSDRKKKRSSRSSRSSLSGLDRAVSPTDRKKSEAKRNSKQENQEVDVTQPNEAD